METRKTTPAKTAIARARPRDERGRFVAMPESRRGRIRAATAALPPELLALVAERVITRTAASASQVAAS